jgi:signal transduction histidine kinase
MSHHELSFDTPTLEAEKLAALKEFAYGASHELNNPLANIVTRAQALLLDEQHPEKRRKLATIVAQAMRAHEMISDLMLFAKPPQPQLAPVLLRTVIEKVLATCREQAMAQGTAIELSLDHVDLSIMADETQIIVALQALVRNALEAVGSDGCITLAVPADQTMATISVTDNGPGISPETRRHLFDPFYSGREAGRGLGFGLCKCWRIAELHGGELTVESELGKGATFNLKLPLQSAHSVS